VSIPTVIQKPVVIGSKSGRGSGFLPATSSASWATVIAALVGLVFSTVTRAFAGTVYV
jgi:hypothetical protein